jgi:hypothetical protein
MSDEVQSGASEATGEELIREIRELCAEGARDDWRTLGLICAGPAALTLALWLAAVLTQ